MSTLNVITLDLADNNKQMISLTEPTFKEADFRNIKRFMKVFGKLIIITKWFISRDHNKRERPPLYWKFQK